MKKNEKNARETKKVGGKKLGNRPKSEREIVFLPVKKLKKGPKWHSRALFFSREKTLD